MPGTAAAKTDHIIITGTAGGIGAALARHFLGDGRRVTGIDRRPGPDDLVGRPGYRAFEADITDEARMAAAFDAAWGVAPVGAVIANAAVTDTDHRQTVDLPLDTWRRVLRTNVDGAFVTARLAARRMAVQGHGNIVFVTSSLGRLSDALPGDAPYCTSKAAVEMLARVMAGELEATGVTVNTLFPSVKIDTGFFAHLDAGARAALAPATLLNASAGFLVDQPPGGVTGRSLDQERWDRDPDYRASWHRRSVTDP